MRTPIKGRPFSQLSHKELLDYSDLFQKFCHAYRGVDNEKYKILAEILKDLSDEHTERLCEPDFNPSLEKFEKNFSAKNGLMVGKNPIGGKKVLKKFKKSIDKRL